MRASPRPASRLVKNASDMAMGLTHRTHGDPLTDLVLVERAEELVAHVGVEWRDHASGALELQVSLVIAPRPDLRGVAAELLDWAFARGRQFAQDAPPDRERWFAAWCSDGETWTRAALDTAGFRAVRHFPLLVRQRLDDLEPPPAAAGRPRGPAGRAGAPAPDLGG